MAGGRLRPVGQQSKLRSYGIDIFIWFANAMRLCWRDIGVFWGGRAERSACSGPVGFVVTVLGCLGALASPVHTSPVNLTPWSKQRTRLSDGL